MPYGMDWDEFKPNGYSGQLWNPPVVQKRDPVATAVERLKAQGLNVERSDFPPAPLPGLYVVNGRELTEGQLIQLSMA